VGLQEIFNMLYNLRTWYLWLCFPSEGRCAADFYRPSKSIALVRFKPVTFRSSGKYINHYTTKATCWNDTDRENQKNSGEKLVPVPLSTLSTTNSTWVDPGTDLGLHGERLATNCLSNGRDSTLN
jgi:hypothetical protein